MLVILNINTFWNTYQMYRCWSFRFYIAKKLEMDNYNAYAPLKPFDSQTRQD
jgi:hypothetical protein